MISFLSILLNPKILLKLLRLNKMKDIHIQFFRFKIMITFEDMFKIACVLLVDDDSLNNLINGKLFSKIESIELVKIIDTPVNGLQFIDEYYLKHIKLPEYIITDINMPGTSGFKFIETFRSKYPDIYNSVNIVFTSASLSKNDILKLQHVENHLYIDKPFTKDKLEKLFQIK